jgi:peptide/nickel transport system permease protein
MATATDLTLATDRPKFEPISPGQLAWRSFRHHRMAMAALVILGLLVLYVIFGGLFVRGYCKGYDAMVTGEKWANCNDTSQVFRPPSLLHPFGTDGIGRDILARTIYGGQISFLIGIAAAIIEVTVGTLVGSVAAFYGGWVDSLLMRFTEAMLNIPTLFLLIVTAKFFGGKLPSVNIFGRELTGSVIVIIVIIGATSWMYLARIVRASVLSLREMDYIAAARALGVSDFRLILAHLLPNTLAPITVAATLGVANAILSEAYVSFFGLGVQTPTASWGNMLDSAYRYLETAPWLWFFTGSLILLTVLSVNYVGDGLRDALDPHGSKHV